MVLAKANKLYRDWRCTLGTIYKKFTTDDERKENIPDGVEKEAWEELIKWFGSPAFKKMSTRNQASRKQQKEKQICGRTSFQAKRYANKDPVTGELPNNLDFWVMTHQKPNGEFCDEFSQGKHERMVELTKGTENCQPLLPDDAVLEVLGTRSGHVRGQGCGPKATQSGGLRERAERAERECENLRGMVTNLDNTFDMRVQVAIEEHEVLRRAEEEKREAERRESEDSRIRAIVAAMMTQAV